MNEFEMIANEQVGSYVSIIESVGMADPNPDIDLEEMLTEQIKLIMNLVPAFLALLAIILAFLVQWVSYKIINRVDKQNYHFPPFRMLRLPSSLIWLYLIVILVSFFNLDSAGMFFVGIQNLLFILEILLVIQGFSFLFYFADHKKWPKAIPIISVIITIIFPIFLLYFVRILGIIDIGFNLRDRLEKKNK